MRIRHDCRKVSHHSPLTTHHSPGFTLVELLVVIAIIAVLVALTAAGVMRARQAVEQVRNRHNITQMETSIQAFTAKGPKYIPSRIVLRNDGNYDMSNPLERASLAYLKQLWKLPTPAAVWNGSVPANDPRFSLGWCPDDPAAAATPSGATLRYELEGDQCIVFFLGGMQVGGACQGFSSNVSNPTLLNTKFNPPFMDFPTDQLKRMPTDAASITRTPLAGTTSSAFLSFIDPYGQPYAYFSSQSFGRRLTPSDAGYVAARDGQYARGPGYARLDCAGLFNADGTAANVAPHFEPSGKFYNRDGFQIISAGYDKMFGANLDPSTGASVPYRSSDAFPFQSPSAYGHDDMTNFHGKILGAPQ